MNKVLRFTFFLFLSSNILGQKPSLYWSACYGGSGIDIAYDIIETSDSCYLFCGVTTSNNGDVTGTHGGGDAWVVILSGSGSIIWEKCFGVPGFEELLSIIETTDHC